MLASVVSEFKNANKKKKKQVAILFRLSPFLLPCTDACGWGCHWASSGACTCWLVSWPYEWAKAKTGLQEQDHTKHFEFTWCSYVGSSHHLIPFNVSHTSSALQRGESRSDAGNSAWFWQALCQTTSGDEVLMDEVAFLMLLAHVHRRGCRFARNDQLKYIKMSVVRDWIFVLSCLQDFSAVKAAQSLCGFEK